MRSFLPILTALFLLTACSGGFSVDAPVASVTPSDGTPEAKNLCTPGRAPLEFTGAFASSDAKTNHMLPFTVGAGTGRIELSYGWAEKAGPPSTMFTSTTLDLGLWDQHGYRSAEGFRGWSGSRQGRLDQDHGPVYIEASKAERGYVPGVIVPGVWTADLGVGAVSPQGADWVVKVACKAATGVTPADDPVDRTHVARNAPGWYLGDFHMHAYHSNPNAPDWDGFVAQAKAAKLDFLMVTEYVTGQHWHTLGAVQRKYPELLIWPGREIITYYGHVMGHGETPHVLEFRHGFEDVNIRDIQKAIKADGALFQINHPTSFPGPVFANFCRGCEFQLGDQIDWDQVDTMEILNGPVLVSGDDIGVPLPVGQIENPFMTTALKLWDDQLRAGHRIVGVSGSDSKGVDAEDQRARKGYGSSATAVHAKALSRAALTEAIKAGHAYVKTRGAAGSPSIEFEATTADGHKAIFGDTLTVELTEAVTLKVTVTGGSNQLLTLLQNGVPLLEVPVTADPFVFEFPAATRNPLTEGPLGTWWRIETRDTQTRTTLGNPIFLKGG